MTHETAPKGSILDSLEKHPVQESWQDVGGKTVQVQISVAPSQNGKALQFLGVAGQMSAGDIRGLGDIESSNSEVQDDIIRLHPPTGNGLVDSDAFKTRMQLWAEENAFAVVQ